MACRFGVIPLLVFRILDAAKVEHTPRAFFLQSIGDAASSQDHTSWGTKDAGSLSSTAKDVWLSLSSFEMSLQSFGVHMENRMRSPRVALPPGNSTSNTAMPARRQQMYFRPVSTTLRCVMFLTISSLVAYTVLSIFRNKDELSASFQPSQATQTFTIVARVVTFAPMLCMLFVACRMYVLATTEGLGEPPTWVKRCMWLCVGGVVMQHVLVLLMPQFLRQQALEEASYDMTFGKSNVPRSAEEESAEEESSLNIADAVGEFNDVHPALERVGLFSQNMFWIGQCVSLALIYIGIGGVIYGIATFPGQTTKVSPAVMCTVALACVYFLSTLLLWNSRAFRDAQNQFGQLSPLTDASLAMSTVVRKAPMFAVLFLASRMRALQLDPPFGMPPFWMQCLFYTITALVYIESILAFAVGATGKKDKGYYGVYIFHSANKSLPCLQHVVSLVSSVIVVPILLGVTWMPDDSGNPAPLSTTLRCVLAFQWVYFGVCFWQSLILLLEEAAGMDWMLHKQASIAAGISLNLAPLLSILFVATRMRALQITQQKGNPQGWAQDCMDIAVFATCVQAMCCLLMPWFVKEAVKVDDDGNPDYDLQPMVGAYAIAIVKYVMLLLLHSSIVSICMAIEVMTPENAHSGKRLFNSMESFFQGLAFILVIFFLALLFSSAKVIGMAVKIAIETADKEFLGVDITIKDLAFNLFKGYVKIKDFVVQQPQDVVIYTRDESGKLIGKKNGEKCDWVNPYLAKVRLVIIKVNFWRIVKTLGKEFEVQNLSIVGIHLNFEKPSFSTDPDSNVEYITNYMESKGLIPPKEAQAKEESKEEPKKEEPKKEEAKKEEPKKEEPKKEEPEEAKKEDATKVILHKIDVGDFGVKVTLKKKYSFAPNIPEFEFDDITRDVLNGKEDLSPGKTVACVVKAVAHGMWQKASHEIPQEVLRAVVHAKDEIVEGVSSAAREVSKKFACCGKPGTA